MIMAVFGMPAQAPQGWGNWQQGPGQVPNQNPFQSGQNGMNGGGAGAAFRAANPQGMGGTGAPPPSNMMPPGSGGGYTLPPGMTPGPGSVVPGQAPGGIIGATPGGF